MHALKRSLIGKEILLLNSGCEPLMCELTVRRKDEVVFDNAVYAKAEGNKVTVRDVLGVSKVFDDCTIGEVDISKERLLLKPINK